MLAVVTLSTVELKDVLFATCTTYCFAAVFGSHESKSWLGPDVLARFCGSWIVRVKSMSEEYGPWTFPG